MPTVRELSAPYANFLLTPRAGPGVCDTCFNLTDGYEECYACTRSEHGLDVVLPISYSVAGEQLHHALAAYKRLNGYVGRRLAVELAAVLWRFLHEHEQCAARAAATQRFDVVTTVPSTDPERDKRHPLRWIVGELIGPTRTRHEHVLRPSQAGATPHEYSSEKFASARRLRGEPVLLIDDTWTTGANAQSAAAALKAAGAGPVAAIVIGRHVNRGWHENDRRLCAIARPFDWSECVLCAPRPG
jgi:predicted amidophosphoribosyltransferase